MNLPSANDDIDAKANDAFTPEQSPRQTAPLAWNQDCHSVAV